MHNRSFPQGDASAPGRERPSRVAAAALLGDARFRRAREPVERLLGGAQQLPKRSGQRRPIRHCEEPLRRSNPGATTCAALGTQTLVRRPLDCFASLAMTDRELAYLFLRVASDRGRRAVRGYARYCDWQVRLVMTALRSMDVDSLATLGASGMAARNAPTVKPPQPRAIGPSIALGKSKLSSEIAQGGACLWRRRSYLSAFLRRPADP